MSVTGPARSDIHHGTVMTHLDAKLWKGQHDCTWSTAKALQAARAGEQGGEARHVG